MGALVPEPYKKQTGDKISRAVFVPRRIRPERETRKKKYWTSLQPLQNNEFCHSEISIRKRNPFKIGLLNFRAPYRGQKLFRHWVGSIFKMSQQTAEMSTASAPESRPAKLTGREFYKSIGSPKYIVAPMVERSEFVRIPINFCR